ncbi:putative NAD(P)H quinone oxidoreductase, PIG3 family [Marininema mesophilum]|uniref:Putative NAD(P)H quinone oxidoreductase, PIG3 family n=1 Tax=Marininema mesophilum TaxID=1048340 RepID=A0A1H2YN88_9BACL|nr:NAD(P)H-quinone oxidoreductase [Marininema mesophilum]SDX06451.1 putative NAD(P)H quinone oxidoreductase, PIG3 family [Marininema mesophilum]
MKAVLIDQPGGPDSLKLGEYPTPKPTPNELLVRVKATALNRADIMQREGKYPPPSDASPILGLEMAGIVEEVGENSGPWKKGDRVFGLLPGGGYAEYAVIPGEMAMPIPEGMSFFEAAGVAEVFLTAWQALFWIGRLQAGERVLIHAGASGVGTAAIQLAKHYGAFVAVTAGSEEKLAASERMGANVGVNYTEGPFEPKLRNAVGEEGFDLVLDFIGAPYWEQNLRALTLDGRLVLISTLGGSHIKGVDLAPILRKRLQVTGTTLRSRSLSYKTRLTKDFVQQGLPLFQTGAIRPVIDQTFAWEEVQTAHQYMEENRNIGKIVLEIN